MKLPFTLTALTMLAGSVFADVVVEQKMESALLNGNMVMKIKGDKARMDMPGGIAGQMSVIVDPASGEMTTLMHSQKMAMKVKTAAALKNAEAQQKAAGLDPAKIEKPVPTGEKEKVGEWDTEIYTMKTGTGEAKLWVAKDFPNYKTLTEQMNKLSSAVGGGAFDPSKTELPGMVVKSEMGTAGGKVTTTLIKAKEEAVADSEFVVPKDYKEIANPLGQ